MQIDLELYRREVRVSQTPPIDLSVIEIAPDLPERTLVFVHGFGGQASQWIYQLQEFSRQNRVIAIDLRGHGRSDKPGGEYRMPELQSDLLAALQALEVNEPFTLIGHSFGGAIAAQFAADHPDYVERLALIATAGEFRLNPLSRSLLRLPTPLLQALNPYTKRWLKAPPQVLKPLYWNTMARWNGWSLFRSLNLPTLVIRGHLDIVLERPLFEEVARLIPGAEEVDVGYSGHMVMLERRQAVNRALDGFLKQAPRSWREAGKPPARKQPNLERARPWLAHYEPGVPKTTGIPRVGLPSLLRSARRRFANHTALIFEGARLSYRYLYEECQRFAWAL